MIQVGAQIEGPDGAALVRALSSRRDLRATLVLIFAYAAIVLAIAPFAGVAGPPMPQAVAVFTTGIIIAELATAFLLLIQLEAAPDWSILLIACAFLYSALMGIAHLLTFPGAILADRTVFGSGQLTSYVYNGWRSGYAVLILAALLVPASKRQFSASTWKRISTASLALVACTVTVAFAVGVAAEHSLPLAVSGTQFTLLGLVLSWSALVGGVIAVLLLLIRIRRGELLYLWLTLVMVTFCGDLFLSTFGGGRFTLGWYAGRASGFISACTLFLFFLGRFAVQQRLAIEAARALRQRTLSLQLEVARRSEAEERLVQAQKIEAMGQLTGGIAHDFNNLLAAIIGSLDMLRRRAALDVGAARWVENALAAAERGTKLTSQLLVFSRSQRLELSPVNVADVVAGMRELLTRTLGPQIRIGFRLDAADTRVLCEPTQLELAILNLALNARDAMPEGGDLTISTTPRRVDSDPELAPGDYLQLSVADTGVGMTEEVLARAFDPFFTTKGVGKGTGLGLSQVFGIARKAGGTARIEGRPGEGTTVHMLLRRTEATEPALDAKPPSSIVPPVAVRVLIIDDDPAVREVLANLVGELGLGVMQAADGASGLDLLERSKPDLLLVDFAMPGLNGAEVARRARARRPDLPIVFVTGYADTTAIEDAVGRQALILKKPFRNSELQAIMSRAVQRAG